MANWLVNLNWSWRIEIWMNCRKNGRAAIGWMQWTEDEMDNPGSFRKATGYMKKMRPGDRIVGFLKDRRLGGWGTVVKPYDESVFDPQLQPGTKQADFGRVVHVRWEDAANPPIGQAARMRPEDVHGFTCLSSVNPLNDESFERLKKILADKTRWEPLSELTEESEAEEEAPEHAAEEWISPLREAALRKILAGNLAQIEPGLVPLDAKNGAEEVSVGAAGRIDLLCKDKAGNVVVIELKRDNSSDRVIGQLARYMGYVKKNHLPKGKIVRGIIVSHEADERLKLALDVMPNVELKLYDVRVSFRSPA